MNDAPCSWRVSTYRIEEREMASTKWIFSSPGIPNTWVTPSFSRHSTISSAVLREVSAMTVRLGGRPSGEGPDGRALDVAAFQHALAGNVVAGQPHEPVTGQIGPAEVADQDSGSAGVASFRELRHLPGQVPFVES